jgi:hypothetical protein
METQQSSKPAATTAHDDWYEHGFARVENSRKRGVTSMPMPYAQTLMKWASYIPGADLAGLLVIDPACGSGNTLLAATQALAARGRVRRWGAERVAQEIERCIWGLDPDPVACHVAELRLHRLIAHVLPDLPAGRRKALQLHIHQTDSLMLPVDARFRLVITNPPLATARGVVVSYGGFESKAPPRDVWLRFLEQSMRLVAYDGALAIALPEALLQKPAAAALRAELQRDWTIEHLAHLTGVFRSGPGTVMLLARRTPPTPEAMVAWERIERLSLTRVTKETEVEDPGDEPPKTIHSRAARAEHRIEGTISQATIGTDPRAPWRYALGTAERALVERMARHGVIGTTRLGDLVQVTRGAELVKDAPEITHTALPNGVKLIRAIDIEPFQAQSGRAWLPASAFKTAPDAWRGTKIVLPRAASQLMAALDDSGGVPMSNVITLQPRADDPHAQQTLLLLLALLNTPPLRMYLTLTLTAYQLARPTIDLDALRDLPIAKGPADARQRLINLAQELVRHISQHGIAPDNSTQYPVAQRLMATIAVEATTLYGLIPADLDVVQRWQS